jgi:hypothetical protein
MDVLPSLKVVVNGVALATDGKLDESYIHIIADGFFLFSAHTFKVSKSSHLLDGRMGVLLL